MNTNENPQPCYACGCGYDFTYQFSGVWLCPRCVQRADSLEPAEIANAVAGFVQCLQQAAKEGGVNSHSQLINRACEIYGADPYIFENFKSTKL